MSGLALGGFFLGSLLARPALAEPAPRVAVVELFSSEGCSSCPPAERVLAALSREGRVGGAALVTIEWHVDYWNYLGWADPFSSRQQTQRQEEYARVLGDGRVYTPQLVVDGQAETVGSNEPKVRRLIEGTVQAARLPRATVRLAHAGDALTVEVSEVPTQAGAAHVWLLLTESGLVSAVQRGENAGATLAHGPVVRLLRDLGPVGTQPFRSTVPLALDSRWRRAALSAVALVQQAGSGARAILGAAALPLSAAPATARQVAPTSAPATGGHGRLP